MNQRRIPCDDLTSLRLHHVAGDLTVRGWDKDEIVVESDGDVGVESVNEVLELSIAGDGRLSMPAELPIGFEVVGGDALFADVRTAIEGKRIGGDLRLEQSAASNVAAVGGDAKAARCTGSLRIGTVGGDLMADSVEGDISASVGGDLRVVSALGAIMANAGGDAKVDFTSVSDSSSAIQAGGDIQCRLPADVNVTLNLQYGGRLHTGAAIPERNGSSHVSRLVLGAGTRAINLLAGGDILLSARGAAHQENAEETVVELEESMRRMADNLGAQLEAMATQLETQLEALPYGDELSARITERLQRAMERAEANVEKAIRSAERHAAKVEARVGSARTKSESLRTRGFVRPVRARREPIGDDERAAVLHMVEEKKISPEQAELLLSAMETG